MTPASSEVIVPDQNGVENAPNLTAPTNPEANLDQGNSNFYRNYKLKDYQNFRFIVQVAKRLS